MDVGWLGGLVGSFSTWHETIGLWVWQLGCYLNPCQKSMTQSQIFVLSSKVIYWNDKWAL